MDGKTDFGQAGATRDFVTPSGETVGYARVSTREQSTARQVTELKAAGCSRVYEDAGVSGATMERPQLQAALGYLRAGDTLVVQELSRLGRSTLGVVALAEELTARGVGLRVLGMGVDTSTPTGRMVLAMMAAVAEMERELLRERITSGIAEARRQGRQLGRPTVMGPEQVQAAQQLRDAGASAAEVARVFGVSKRSIQRLTHAGPDAA